MERVCYSLRLDRIDRVAVVLFRRFLAHYRLCAVLTQSIHVRGLNPAYNRCSFRVHKWIVIEMAKLCRKIYLSALCKKGNLHGYVVTRVMGSSIHITVLAGCSRSCCEGDVGKLCWRVELLMSLGCVV